MMSRLTRPGLLDRPEVRRAVEHDQARAGDALVN